MAEGHQDGLWRAEEGKGSKRADRISEIGGKLTGPGGDKAAAGATPQQPEEATDGRDPAVDPAILAIEGDTAYGEYLASDCTTCHQADGADKGIPSITGWPRDAFVTAMHAYKAKARSHPVMQMMAGRLSNEEIAALAAYFGELE
ncbi:MAG: c-type cytochrome [Pseudomonadota bacterium]